VVLVLLERGLDGLVVVGADDVVTSTTRMSVAVTARCSSSVAAGVAARAAMSDA
jgi:hypothetical protein